VPIEVVEYDAAWPDLAARARAELHAIAPGLFPVIEHVGSTSVPGLAAKPVIDLMAAAPDLGRVAEHEGALLAAGYRPHDTGMPGRLFFYRDRDGVRSHHLHVVQAETLATRNELLLRDYLRAHPADAARYAALKRSLAAASMSGDSYTRAKTELIQELTDSARAERGLPPVPVWEE
jgi:GrpB-like predicted nucleotidyltransferase (UPF0157 family)